MNFGDKSTGWTHPLHTEKCVDTVHSQLHPWIQCSCIWYCSISRAQKCTRQYEKTAL